MSVGVDLHQIKVVMVHVSNGYEDDEYIGIIADDLKIECIRVKRRELSVCVCVCVCEVEKGNRDCLKGERCDNLKKKNARSPDKTVNQHCA